MEVIPLETLELSRGGERSLASSLLRVCGGGPPGVPRAGRGRADTPRSVRLCHPSTWGCHTCEEAGGQEGAGIREQ